MLLNLSDNYLIEFRIIPYFTRLKKWTERDLNPPPLPLVSRLFEPYLTKVTNVIVLLLLALISSGMSHMGKAINCKMLPTLSILKS